jgi:hypothetical protein
MNKLLVSIDLATRINIGQIGRSQREMMGRNVSRIVLKVGLPCCIHHNVHQVHSLGGGGDTQHHLYLHKLRQKLFEV